MIGKTCYYELKAIWHETQVNVSGIGTNFNSNDSWPLWLIYLSKKHINTELCSWMHDS